MKVVKKVSLNRINQKGSAPILVIILIVIVLIVWVILFLVQNKSFWTGNSANNQPLVTNTPPPSSQIANWRTYTYPQFGVAFKLPPNWKVETVTQGTQLAISPPNSSAVGPFYLYYLNNPEGLSLKDYNTKYTVETHEGTNSPGVYSPSAEEVDLTNTKAYLIKDSFCEPVACPQYVIPYGKRIYIFQSQGVFIEGVTRTTIERVLSTLQFLDQSKVLDMSSWSDYYNPKLMFHIEHPSNISILSTDANSVIFVESKYKNFRALDGPPPGVSLQIYRRDGQTPEEGLKLECPSCKFTPVQFNNAQGIKVTSGMTGDNYYLTDISSKGPVVRLFIQNNSDGDTSLFERMIETLEFSR